MHYSLNVSRFPPENKLLEKQLFPNSFSLEYYLHPQLRPWHISSGCAVLLHIGRARINDAMQNKLLSLHFAKPLKSYTFENMHSLHWLVCVRVCSFLRHDENIMCSSSLRNEMEELNIVKWKN